jgi:hypothetical protein
MILFSSKKEYLATSEAAREIRFFYYLLSGMGVRIKLPIVVRCDDVDATFIAENSSLSIHTRYVDISFCP